MEIGPILRAMRANTTRAVLLTLEIAVTLTIVLNALNIIGEQHERISTPSGIDVEHILVVRASPWGAAYREDGFVRGLVDRDLDALRSLPGVVSVSAFNPTPLAGGGSSSLVKPFGAADDAKVRMPLYRADASFVETLGLELVAGRAFTEEDIPREDGPEPVNVIVTRDLAEALFPGEDPLGKLVDTGSSDNPDRIVGVVGHMHTPYGGGPMETRIMFFPRKPGSAASMQYLVRTEPEAFDDVFRAAEGALGRVDAERVVSTRSLAEIRDQGAYAQNRFAALVLSVVTLLLLLVTAIGIFGVASFSVTQRTKQIGTRRALGGTRVDVVRYFLVEVSLIVLFGSALGIAGAYALNMALVANLDGTPLPFALTLSGALGLWGLAILATAIPARRAAAIPPAVATRTV